MYDPSIIGRHKTEVDTPALLLDMGAVERNISRMAQFFADKECKLRPHVKTHKLPVIAHQQVKAGAVGITCAKLSEAEAFLHSGIWSVLIANQIVTPEKIRKMVSLAQYGDLIVAVDDFDNVRAISDAAGSIGDLMSVIVEVNVGINRCGVLPGQPTLDFVRRILDLDNIVFRGLMGYEGGLFIQDSREKMSKCGNSNQALAETRYLLEENGIPVEICSAGGSNTFTQTGICPGITDVQVGSYVTMDTHNREYGVNFEQAVYVLSTVISRPEQGRAVVDAGRKSISLDCGLPAIDADGLSLYALNEEHGLVTVEESAKDLRIGDKLLLIPSHGCTTIPFYDEYVVVRDDCVESIASIPSRHSC